MSKKILIVDDELNTRELLYNAFSRLGFDTITATNGKDAVQFSRTKKPDLILLDFDMPEMNGIEVLKKIRENDAKTKIVMLTGLATDELEKQARSFGATGFLRKTLGIEIITKAVNEILVEKKYAKNKILVVDDDSAMITMLKDFLTKKGYDVAVASNGEEALISFKSVKPLLVLLDINLGGMDGLVVLKRIREIDQNVGVVMITSIDDHKAFEDAKKMGAYEYITKPFTLDYLEIVVLTRLAIVSAVVE
jgi:two-component system response regulator (stage 0 sporulation protein F)